MPTVYNQTVSCRFGVELVDLLANSYWTRFDAAVAWVRRSGLRHILPALADFKRRQGRIRITVGIDIENTSKEGLEDLLSLGIHAFVHHNEEVSDTFHPKVYMLSNKQQACLIVGSNNLTESGLYTNTEAGLMIEAAVSDPVIVQMQAALDSWADTATGFAKQLSPAFLADLERCNYIFSELTLNRRRAASRGRSGTVVSAAPERLFASKRQMPPPPPAPTAVSASTATTSAPRRRPATAAPTSGVGTVLLMRPRFARGTQTQIPIPLKNGPFLSRVDEIISDHDNVARPISGTQPERGGGAVNTFKVEMPESERIADPVVRIWLAPDGRVRYRLFDPDSPDGRFIWQKLEDGRHTTPPQTAVTKPKDPDHATWYRFV